MLLPAEKRITATQVLQHKWFTYAEGKGVSTVTSLPPVMTNHLMRFRTCQRLKQAVLTYLAAQSSESDIKALKIYFNDLDKNGDGILSKDEVMSGIKKSTMGADLTDIVESLDTNSSGFVDYNGTREDY